MTKPPIHQRTPIHPDSMRVGQWYFGLTCQGCGKRFALEEDEDWGTRKRAVARPPGTAAITLQCPHCSCDAEYHPLDVIQWCHRAPHI
jgi:hypothetical protein